jgi:hypothetical protein
LDCCEHQPRHNQSQCEACDRRSAKGRPRGTVECKGASHVKPPAGCLLMSASCVYAQSSHSFHFFISKHQHQSCSIYVVMFITLSSTPLHSIIKAVCHLVSMHGCASILCTRLWTIAIYTVLCGAHNCTHIMVLRPGMLLVIIVSACCIICGCFIK